MELVSEFFTFFIEFMFWVFVFSLVKGYFESRKEEIEQEVDELKEKLVKMIHFIKQERHGDLLYWFDAESDQFLGQGASVEEITEHVKNRFPTHIFIIQEANKYMRGPEWKFKPMTDLESMKDVKQIANGS